MPRRSAAAGVFPRNAADNLLSKRFMRQTSATTDVAIVMIGSCGIPRGGRLADLVGALCSRWPGPGSSGRRVPSAWRAGALVVAAHGRGDRSSAGWPGSISSKDARSGVKKCSGATRRRTSFTSS
jgi:hypothetical protein